MKHSLFTLAVNILIVSTITNACRSYDNSETNEPADATVIEKSISEVDSNDIDAEDYTGFKSSAEGNIREHEGLISKLRQRIDRQKPDRQDEYKARVDTLEMRNDVLRAKLLQYRQTTKEEWEAFKREFKSDMEELGRSLENFADDNTP